MSAQERAEQIIEEHIEEFAEGLKYLPEGLRNWLAMVVTNEYTNLNLAEAMLAVAFIRCVRNDQRSIRTQARLLLRIIDNIKLGDFEQEGEELCDDCLEKMLLDAMQCSPDPQ